MQSKLSSDPVHEILSSDVTDPTNYYFQSSTWIKLYYMIKKSFYFFITRFWILKGTHDWPDYHYQNYVDYHHHINLSLNQKKINVSFIE